MRKVLSFVLVLALVLGSFSMAFASYSDMAGEDSSEAVNVLSGLGVVAGYPDGTFAPDKIVTRAEMAKLIISALGLSAYATGTSSSYSDMAGHWANGFVAYASSLGIITGYPDGTFKPDMTVTYEEAAAMIVRALGYTAEFLPGGWPAEWIIKAQTLGLFDDVSKKTGGANRGDIAQMLYNALDAEIGYVDADGVWQAGNEDDNMLLRLGAEKSTSPEAIRASWIGDEDVTAIDLAPYVYAYAYLYTLDDIIVSLTVDSDEFVAEWDDEANAFLDEDDEEIDVDFDWYDYTYFNGAQTTFGAIDELVDGMQVKAYGYDEDDMFYVDGFIANAPTEVFLADEDDLDDIEEALEDSEGEIFDVVLPMDDDELDMDMIKVIGDASELSDIEENDVVAVWAALDESNVTFQVFRNTEEITITKLTSSKVYAGSDVYEFAGYNCVVDNDDNAEIDEIEDLEVLDEVELFLNADGEIVVANFIEESTTDLFGLVYGVTSSSAFGDTTFEVKILTADDTDVVYEIDADDEDDYGLFMDIASYEDELIEFTLNSDNELVDFDGYDSYAEDEMFNARTGVWNGMFVADDIVVFDIKDWEVASLEDDTYYDAYYIVNDDDEVVALAFDWSDASESDAVYFALNEIYVVANSDDEPVFELVGFEEGMAKTAMTDDDMDFTLDSAPGIYVVTYSGILVSEASFFHGDWYVVDAVGSAYVDINGTIEEVAEDVVVYTVVLDDGDIDSYEVGDMGDIDVDDYVAVAYNSDDEVMMIIHMSESDAEDFVHPSI